MGEAWNCAEGSLGLDCVVSGGVLKVSSPPKSVSLEDLVPGRADEVGDSGTCLGPLVIELVFEVNRASPLTFDVLFDCCGESCGCCAWVGSEARSLCACCSTMPCLSSSSS